MDPLFKKISSRLSLELSICKFFLGYSWTFFAALIEVVCLDNIARDFRAVNLLFYLSAITYLIAFIVSGFHP